jgi:anti-anti-sigma factor
VNKLNTLFSELVKQQLRELVEEAGDSVIFNLENIRFIDSSGFDVLKEITDHALKYGSRFKICNITEDVKELITLLELEGSLEISACTKFEEKILVDLG